MLGEKICQVQYAEFDYQTFETDSNTTVTVACSQNFYLCSADEVIDKLTSFEVLKFSQ